MYRETFDYSAPVGTNPTKAPARRTGIFGWIRARAHRFAKRRTIIRRFREMSQLPDHLLRDVGVHRGDFTETRLRALLKDPQAWDF